MGGGFSELRLVFVRMKIFAKYFQNRVDDCEIVQATRTATQKFYKLAKFRHACRAAIFILQGIITNQKNFPTILTNPNNNYKIIITTFCQK